MVLQGSFQPTRRRARIIANRVIFDRGVVGGLVMPAIRLRSAMIQKAVDRDLPQPGVEARFISERGQRCVSFEPDLLRQILGVLALTRIVQCQ